MAELTPELQKVLKEAGMDGTACWKHKQSGKWIVYHWACERLQAHYGIKFDNPIILENDAARSVALLIVGKREDDAEWSIGECAPGANYKTSSGQPSYPYAMAEKRGKDRVILKLLDLHGGAYSEEEADTFIQRNPEVMEQNRQKADAVAAKHVEKYMDKHADVSDLPRNEQEWKGWGALTFKPTVDGCSSAVALDIVLDGFKDRLEALAKSSPSYHAHLIGIADSKRSELKTLTEQTALSGG